MSAAHRFAVPDGLAALVERYDTSASHAVRFRVPSWETALASVSDQPTKLLTDPSFTSESTVERYRTLGDRVITREAVLHACGRADLADDASVISAFILVMAWGSGTSNPRSLRNTRTALQNASTAAKRLREAALTLRAVERIDDPAIADIHRQFALPGIGEAFFTKWFAFAGYVPEREWQPLILDSRVRHTLHRTLDVWLNQLSDTHRDAERYVAYLLALHHWAATLPQQPTATQLEWVLFVHNGGAL